MSLKSSNKVDTNRYQLEVQVDADAFEKAVDQTYHKENKKIMIPGFRKGKAPRAFVEKYYGSDVFYEGAINALYPDALDSAIQEAGLELVEDKIDFEMVSAGKGGLTFKATITTKPEASVEGYKGIEVTKKPVTVMDRDIDGEIKTVQERNSRMVTVEDREVQDGDIVVIDFEGFVDDKAFDGGKADNYSLTIGAKQFIPGFEDQLIGHKTGEEFEINVKFPEDYQAEELAGKDAMFKIKLHEIKVKELPEIDDDFVKDVSDFDTLDQYKEDIRAKLTEKKENEAKDDIDNQLIDKLVELLKAEIPQAMYENRIDEDIREFAYRLQSQGLSLDVYLQYTGMDQQAFRDGFKEQAERQVKVRLALEAIAKQEGLEATEEDIEAEYAKIAEGYKMEIDQVKKFIRQEDLVKDIVVEKAINLVRDNAVVTEAKEEKAAE